MRKLAIVLAIIGVITIVATVGIKLKLESDRNELKKNKDLPASDYPRPMKVYSEKIKNGKSGITDASDGHEYLVRNRGTNWETCEHYIDCRKCDNGYWPGDEDTSSSIE